MERIYDILNSIANQSSSEIVYDDKLIKEPDPQNTNEADQEVDEPSDLEKNMTEALALRYHGHQFQHYNPDLGDGRGFLWTD